MDISSVSLGVSNAMHCIQETWHSLVNRISELGRSFIHIVSACFGKMDSCEGLSKRTMERIDSTHSDSSVHSSASDVSVSSNIFSDDWASEERNDEVQERGTAIETEILGETRKHSDLFKNLVIGAVGKGFSIQIDKKTYQRSNDIWGNDREIQDLAQTIEKNVTDLFPTHLGLPKMILAAYSRQCVFNTDLIDEKNYELAAQNLRLNAMDNETGILDERGHPQYDKKMIVSKLDDDHAQIIMTRKYNLVRAHSDGRIEIIPNQTYELKQSFIISSDGKVSNFNQIVSHTSSSPPRNDQQPPQEQYSSLKEIGEAFHRHMQKYHPDMLKQ